MTCLVTLLRFYRCCRQMLCHGHFFGNVIFQALPTELQEAVQLGGYIPDISKLTTSLLQEQSLQSL